MPWRPVQISLSFFPAVDSSTPSLWLLVLYTIYCNCPFSYLLSSLEAQAVACSFFRRQRIHFWGNLQPLLPCLPGLLSLGSFSPTPGSLIKKSPEVCPYKLCLMILPHHYGTTVLNTHALCHQICILCTP